MLTESQATDVEDGSASPPKTVSKAASKHEEVEEHNEVCEVCEREGDLVCCDTCPLVFHLQCIRPKIPTVPKGDWSCSFCVLEVSPFRPALHCLQLTAFSGHRRWRQSEVKAGHQGDGSIDEGC